MVEEKLASDPLKIGIDCTDSPLHGRSSYDDEDALFQTCSTDEISLHIYN